MQKTKKLLPIIIGAVVLVALIVTAIVLWKAHSPKPLEGGKSITFQVVFQDKTEKVYEIKTEKEYLADALADEKIITYDEGGFYTTIAGVTADWSDNEAWWKIQKDGVMSEVGMNEIAIADGDHYEAVYTNGY